MTNQVAAEALHRAQHSESMANYGAIFEGFAEKGIPADQIEPRVNVLTFHAWKALGRHVKRGEHGVRVCTWVPMTKKGDDGSAQSIGKRPRMTTVFHVSQTAPIDGDEVRVQALEAEGMTRSDAQGVADAEDLKAGFKFGGFINTKSAAAPEATVEFSTEFTKL